MTGTILTKPTKIPALALSDLMYIVRPADGVAGSAKSPVDNATDAMKSLLADPHINDMADPHSVTFLQLGADPAGASATVQGNLAIHESDVSNPHIATAALIGAGVLGVAANVQGNLTTHLGAVNPHAVTNVQLGADLAGAASAIDTKYSCLISEFKSVAMVDSVLTEAASVNATNMKGERWDIALHNTSTGAGEKHTVHSYLSADGNIYVTEITKASPDVSVLTALTVVGIGTRALQLNISGTNWVASVTVTTICELP